MYRTGGRFSESTNGLKYSSRDTCQKEIFGAIPGYFTPNIPTTALQRKTAGKSNTLQTFSSKRTSPRFATNHIPQQHGAPRQNLTRQTLVGFGHFHWRIFP